MEQDSLPLVKLIWQESGGPEVSPPKQKGFGSHLIERAFAGQLGTAQLVFSPEGLSNSQTVRFGSVADIGMPVELSA